MQVVYINHSITLLGAKWISPPFLPSQPQPLVPFTYAALGGMDGYFDSIGEFNFLLALIFCPQ